MNSHSIGVSPGAPTALARAWMWLGLLALIGSGLLAILLVLSRTPGIQDVFPLKDFFRAALVVHVDLSVAIWFMAFAAVIWSALGRDAAAWMGWVGIALATAGTALMTVSPFLPGAEPVLNNYIPVLQQKAFYASLWICAAGFGLAVLRALYTTLPRPFFGSPLQVGAFVGAVAGFLALAAFVWSWAMVPRVEEKIYFEVLFWGGGHALQFQHALLMVVAWLWIADDLGQPAAAPPPGRPKAGQANDTEPRSGEHLSPPPLGRGPGGGVPISPRALSVMFLVGALPLLVVPAIYLLVPAGSLQHMELFAKLMEWGHPYMAPLILVGLMSLWALRAAPAGPAKSAFVASFLLFAVGGVLAYMIKGVNVVIPAHYHGSTVGVTLAFMGLAYVLLPRLGFGRVEGPMARWQPYVYGGGQLIHILGLAWSGGYGVQRKVAGAEQALTTLPQKIGMGMMGAGGLIAVIGGIMFVLVCLKLMLRLRSRAAG